MVLVSRYCASIFGRPPHLGLAPRCCVGILARPPSLGVRPALLCRHPWQATNQALVSAPHCCVVILGRPPSVCASLALLGVHPWQATSPWWQFRTAVRASSAGHHALVLVSHCCASILGRPPRFGVKGLKALYLDGNPELDSIDIRTICDSAPAGGWHYGGCQIDWPSPSAVDAC